MSKVKVAALQMVSSDALAENLEAAARLISAAAAAGARLVALPENFYLIGRDERDKVRLREAEHDGPIQRFLSQAARRHGLWIVGGTAPLAARRDDLIRSACLVYDDSGARVARYDKMHLFRFESPGERHDEARVLEPGEGPVALESPFGRLALSICYDVRFPEFYRSLGAFDAMFVPSAFTVPTGAAHWHTLLRARAIENQCYVVAPAQGGLHPSGRRTYGHTMMIDPWGDVLAEQAEGEGMALAEIDPERLRRVRAALPALANRKL
jgi:deaminated glutathione amidase